MNTLRSGRSLLFAGRPRPPPAPREVGARRALDRLLLLAIAASLVAAVLERRAREGLGSGSIPSFPVDLASDPPERLRLLPGLGPTRVAALLDERERAGPPSTWTDLERIRGIGAKMLEGWRASGATLEPPPPGALPIGASTLGADTPSLAPHARPPPDARPPPASSPDPGNPRRGGASHGPHAR